MRKLKKSDYSHSEILTRIFDCTQGFETTLMGGLVNEHNVFRMPRIRKADWSGLA